MSAAKCKLLIADDEFWVRENLTSMLAAEKLPFSLLEPAEKTGRMRFGSWKANAPTS